MFYFNMEPRLKLNKKYVRMGDGSGSDVKKFFISTWNHI